MSAVAQELIDNLISFDLKYCTCLNSSFTFLFGSPYILCGLYLGAGGGKTFKKKNKKQIKPTV